MKLQLPEQIISSKNFQILKFVFLLVLGWRLVILFLAYFGLTVLPVHLGHSYVGWANTQTDYWIRWSNWDGGHFRGIAENGYLIFQVVFFPLYPLLIKGLMSLGIPSLLGSLLISNLSIIGALFFLYKLILLDFEESVAKKAIFALLAFPTAFYFGAAYSESLFLFLSVSAFYFTRIKNYGLALLLAGLASVVRLTGLVVILSIAVEYMLKTSSFPTLKQLSLSLPARFSIYLFVITIITNYAEDLFLKLQYYFLAGAFEVITLILIISACFLLTLYLIQFFYKKIDYSKIFSKQILHFFFSLLPFAGFCLYLYVMQGNFFAFVSHEQQWQRELTTPWSAPVEYFKNLFNIGFFRIDGTSQQLIEFTFFVIFSILLIISAFKLRLSYTVYFAVSLLLPISTGTLQAIHRYGMVIFPVFIILALIKNETYYHLWLYFSLSLLGILTVLFFNGYWVS